MKKSLTLSNQTSATLNYLVFLQNAVLNEMDRKKRTRPKFPCLSGISSYLKPSDEFMDSFQACWNAVVKDRKSTGIRFDPLLADRNWDQLTPLFQPSEPAMDMKRKSIDFFLSWWFQPSIGGYLLLDHFGIHTIEYMYTKLKSFLDEEYENYEIRCCLEVVYEELELFPELRIADSIDYVVISKGQLPDFRLEEDVIKHHPEQIDLLVDQLIALARPKK